MLLDQFITVLLLRTTTPPHPQRHPRRTRDPVRSDTRTPTGTSSTAVRGRETQQARVKRPDEKNKGQADEGADDDEQQPVLAHPEDQLGVLAVPTIALERVEETPWVLGVLVGHENADAARPGLLVEVAVLVDPVLPDHGEEQGPRRRHDGDVGQEPGAVGALQGLDDAEEEGVLRDRSHGVVADARGHCAAQPGGVRQQRVQASLAPVVQIDVDAAVVREHEVADCVGALDRVLVPRKRRQEPGVFLLDEGHGLGVRPHHIFIVWVEVDA